MGRFEAELLRFPLSQKQLAATISKAALEEAQDGVASWGAELYRLLADECREGRLLAGAVRWC